MSAIQKAILLPTAPEGKAHFPLAGQSTMPHPIRTLSWAFLIGGVSSNPDTRWTAARLGMPFPVSPPSPARQLGERFPPVLQIILSGRRRMVFHLITPLTV